MGYLLGIDLGTSGVKVMLMSENGELAAIAGQEYDMDIPKPGYAQQDPDMWYEKTIMTIKKCLSKAPIDKPKIEGISFSGQMHGLVCVDKSGRPIYPAIIWPDARTGQTIGHIYEKAGAAFIAGQTQNKITTGFLIASLYWLYENCPDVYEKIDKVLLPKDYIKFRLTGEIVTDYSDAAGSLAFDNMKLSWSRQLIEKLGLAYNLFPACHKSTDIIGTISHKASLETDLEQGLKVVNGGSDQCMQGIGNGIIKDGIFAANIGTGGQISTTSAVPVYDKLLRTNTFAHVVDGRWNIMGACLTSGASLKWLNRNITGVNDYELLNENGKKIPAGSEGLIFLPYLSGERTPYQNPCAKGVFFGLSLKHDKYHMARAVMEGVAYSLKDCMAVVQGTGIPCRKIIASGGGAGSELWLQILADVLETEIYKNTKTEQACMGAAITAGVGLGIFSGFEEACSKVVRLKDKVYTPDEASVERYREYYGLFQEIYASNEKLFGRLWKMQQEQV